MKLTRLLTVSIVVLFFAACTNQQTTKEENWIQLFNGKDLTGWDFKISSFEMNDNYKNTFILEDGILKANYTEYDTFRNNYAHIYSHSSEPL
ncbi:MAG: hypothetical protein O2887_05820 [Bacteroidetes bacterium]|nr:hypothetical protein [Bacteroidota bacterium]MDA1119999.1 hypothetical protein [Bacteroidota bacterium]